MKTFLLTVAAAVCWLPAAWAYTPEGPGPGGGLLGDAWQVQSDGYGTPRDLVTPKNLGEEYRRNVPVVYYACDESFLDYFGGDGLTALDTTFATLNNVFTNNPTGMATGLDGYSQQLSEFPLNAGHLNYQAYALGMVDLKSYTLGLMMRELGLADPIYYVWNIHGWDHVGTVPCPVGQEYLVVQRNFDFISSPKNQLQYSAYINNVLFTYEIVETCTATPITREAVSETVDLSANPYTPVASGPETIDWGNYYTDLTRDDVAGLRHLMSASTLRWETVSPDSLAFSVTIDTNTPEVFPPYVTGGTNFVSGTNGGYYIFTGTTNGGYGYGDLAAFLAFTATNPPAAVEAAYPGVVISSSSWSEKRGSNVTYIAYYTNAPIGSPYGSPPVLVVKTNYSPVFQFFYNYTFANVFTNHYVKSYENLISVTVGAPVGSPYGSPGITNTTVRKIASTSGDFFVLPLFYGYTNAAFGKFGTNVCPIDILPDGSIPTVLAYTNLESIAATNTTTLTNSAATNLTSYVYLVTYFTNYSYVINPVTCGTIAGATGLYEGIEKIAFIGTNFDSLLGQYFYPITNNYTMKVVTNGQVQVQYLQRIVTQPDYLFSAADLVSGPGAPLAVPSASISIDFDQANVPTGLAGPGTINSPAAITFEKAGPVYFNYDLGGADIDLNGTAFFTENPGSDVADLYYDTYWVWATYDGTTNTPEVYPNGTSIDNLDYQILVNVTPAAVPGGQNGVVYHPVTFTATSSFFAQPYTWSAANLPPGLNLLPNGVLSGTPTQSGSYVFTLTLTDNLSRSVQWLYAITIQ
jgi:hypothetical protein